MSSFPFGGMGVQNNDVGRVELMSAVYGPDSFLPPVADGLTPAGTILARVTATGELTPYNVANLPAGSNIPLAVLGDDLQATGVAVQNITVIKTGQVRLARLIVTIAGVPQTAGVVTQTEQDQLKDQGIFALDSFNLSKLDNQ